MQNRMSIVALEPETGGRTDARGAAMGERDQRATVTVSRANRLAQLASWHEEGSLSRYAQAGCSQPPSTSSGATADGTGCNDAVETLSLIHI